jgi:hypothetical protein
MKTIVDYYYICGLLVHQLNNMIQFFVSQVNDCNET